MLDYWKLRIWDPAQIAKVLSNKRLKKLLTIKEDDGTVVGINGQYLNWKIQTITPRLLEISGSIHKYWNSGTNENDFTFLNAMEAIHKFCREFDLDPSLAQVVNLEFGVNLQLATDASEIIEQIRAFHYNPDPIIPYGKRPNCFFVEYEKSEYFLKVYDKGKQYRGRIPGLPNTLRLEIKAMKGRYLKKAGGIETLADLLLPHKLQDLAGNFANQLERIVFDDDTINIKELTRQEQKLYRELDSRTFWKKIKGKGTSTVRAKISRYKKLIERAGQRKIYSMIQRAVAEKIRQLSEGTELAEITANTYTRKTDKMTTQ
jgi:hypothetical protein